MPYKVKKLKKQLKKMDSRLKRLEHHEHRTIGFDYLYNYHDENEFDYEED